MKIVFLDVDGVLNSVRYDRQRGADEGNIDRSRLPLLKRLIDKTQAQIVLSSSWRKHWDADGARLDGVGREMVALFAEYGLSIYGKTDCLDGNDRAEEIRAWLAEHADTEEYVILDDIAFGWGAELQAHLVRTDPRIGWGLGDAHIDKAIAILGGEKQKRPRGVGKEDRI